MRKILVVFDDNTANLLAKYPNKSEIIRQATKLYIEHILPDTLEGMRASFKMVVNYLREIDSKIDFLDKKL